jgi:hypothetical protein
MTRGISSMGNDSAAVAAPQPAAIDKRNSQSGGINSEQVKRERLLASRPLQRFAGKVKSGALRH